MIWKQTYLLGRDEETRHEIIFTHECNHDPMQLADYNQFIN